MPNVKVNILKDPFEIHDWFSKHFGAQKFYATSDEVDGIIRQ